MRRIFLMVLLCGLWILGGCAPQTGDACETSSQCPQGLFCDITAPGGYCTLDNCAGESGRCAEEAVCVAFDAHTSYCLQKCDSQEDCREDYRCVDPGEGGQRYCYVAP